MNLSKRNKIMEKKNKIDLFGASALIGFSLILGINHIVIKLVNSGFNPIFFAGLRSIIAFLFLITLMKLLKKPVYFNKEYIFISILAGIVFALEFLFLFLALDLTSVSRNSIIYYSMPVWLSIFAHFFIPNEKLNTIKIIGLISAFTGVTLSIVNSENDLSFTNDIFLGDIFAFLSALTWALIILLVKGTKFNQVSPEM